MEVIKLKDKSNGAIIEVKKSLASDYIGTGKYVAVVEEKEIVKATIKENTKETEKFGKKLGFGKNN